MSVGPIAQRVLQRIGQQVRSKVVNLDAIREGNAYAEALQQSAIKPDNLKDMHPAHAIYTHAQNQMSVMAEQLLELRDMETFGKLISKAQDDYMPSWPPMSPVTTSFFWCWAGFDLSVNAHRETLGTIILAVGEEWNIHPTMLNWMRALQNSRMGVFRVESHAGRTVQLTDLVTTQGYTAVCNSGYNGRTGELWFTRVLPPALPDQPEHVVFTSPYVLIAPNLAGWMAYFDRIAAKDSPRPRVEALERRLKWGPTRRYWTEFVFEGYVNHEAGAIYLEGLPDAPESRPHSPQYVRSDQDG
jgi:hypothetical protein